MRPTIPFLALLLLTPHPQGLTAVTCHWPITGTFSDMCSDALGDTTGTEVHIVLADLDDGPQFFAIVQSATPALSVPVVVPVENPDHFSFSFVVPGPHPVTFIGQLLPDRLCGTFFGSDGIDRSVDLPRSRSFWSDPIRSCGRP